MKLNYRRFRIELFLAVVAALSTSHLAQVGSIVFVQCGPACDGQVPQPNSDYISVATGNYQTLGLRSNGTVVSWGFCGKQSCDLPTPNSGITAIACGDAFNLFMREGGVIEVSGHI